MIAIKRLQSIMWILIVAMGALSAYLISLRVATERNAVTALERQIYQTRGNIRYLEVEFGTRASMSQLEAWNNRDIRYSVPSASQYLSGEAQLASLDRITPTGKAAVAPPVMAAMADAEAMPASATAPADAPANGPAGATMIPAVVTVPMAMPVAPAPVKAVATRKPADGNFTLIRAAAAAEPALAPKAVARPAAKLGAEPANRRATRLALLDQSLLDASTLRRVDRTGGESAR